MAEDDQEGKNWCKPWHYFLKFSAAMEQWGMKINSKNHMILQIFFSYLFFGSLI